MHPITILLSTLLAAGGQAPLSPETAIVGARLEIGDGRVIANGTLVMRGDRIVQVGENLPAPAGAKVVDGKGLTVYPGFVDAYATTGLNLPDAVPSGSNAPDTTTTAPATMWHENRRNIRADVNAAKSLDPKETFADRKAQGITTVLLSGGTGWIAGTAALFDLTAKPKALVANAAEVFLLPDPGAGGGGADEGMQGGRRAAGPTAYSYPETLYGDYGLMRQTLWDAKGYAAEAKPKADPTYEGLRPLMTGAMPALFNVHASREIARAAHLADEFGFRMIVYGPSDAYRMIDTLKAHRAAAILTLLVADAPSRTPGTAADATPQRVLDDRYARYQERAANAKLLDDAGIPIAFHKSYEDYLTGVRKLVAASGLSREAALRAMTINPARIYGVSDRIGSLEVGKLANLVVMSGDFLDAKSQVRSTIVEGVPFEAAKKETAK